MKQTAILAAGTPVEVIRINGEKRRGYIAGGPLEWLRHIGPFYAVSEQKPGKRRKTAAFGTYDARDIRVV